MAHLEQTTNRKADTCLLAFSVDGWPDRMKGMRMPSGKRSTNWFEVVIRRLDRARGMTTQGWKAFCSSISSHAQSNASREVGPYAQSNASREVGSHVQRNTSREIGSYPQKSRLRKAISSARGISFREMDSQDRQPHFIKDALDRAKEVLFSNYEEVPFGAQEEERRLVHPVIVGLVVVVVLVVAIAIGTLVGGKSTPAFTVETAEDSVSTDDEASQRSGTIFVYVTGCVAHPGVYELSSGTRKVDAIEAAGGMTEEAAADAVNLAELLKDGDQVNVLSEEEVAANATSSATASAANTSGSGSSASGGSAATGSAIDANGRVNVNIATAEELQTVSGIGPSTAQKIIEERTANGPFSSVDDLTRVSGIGEKRLANMRDHLTV